MFLLAEMAEIWCGSFHQVTQSVMAQNALTESMMEEIFRFL
jgi:mannose-6-phosphate isomerase class I